MTWWDAELTHWLPTSLDNSEGPSTPGLRSRLAAIWWGCNCRETDMRSSICHAAPVACFTHSHDLHLNWARSPRDCVLDFISQRHHKPLESYSWIPGRPLIQAHRSQEHSRPSQGPTGCRSVVLRWGLSLCAFNKLPKWFWGTWSTRIKFTFLMWYSRADIWIWHSAGVWPHWWLIYWNRPVLIGE